VILNFSLGYLVLVLVMKINALEKAMDDASKILLLSVGKKPDKGKKKPPPPKLPPDSNSRSKFKIKYYD